MKAGSLFSGVDALGLGIEKAGIRTIWRIENNEYCREVLRRRWPKIPVHGDIRQCTGLEPVDLIYGGFPCPAFSMAGKRGGFDQDDLFFEMLRIVNEISPRYVIMENVEGFRKWREEALHEIESLGYQWLDCILDARDVGVPQSRRRWFAICVRRGNMFDTQRVRRIWREQSESLRQLFSDNQNAQGRWTPTIQTKDEWRLVFAHGRRVRDDHGDPHRMDRLRAVGNAVVPNMGALAGSIVRTLEEARILR